MAIPEDRASTVPIGGKILPPNDRFRPDMTAYHSGGIAISDPSEGLQYQVWVAQGYPDRIEIYPEGSPGLAQAFVTGASNIEFVALAFDQNMRPVLAYTENDVTKLFWYDPVPQDFVTTEFPGATSPFCIMDDTRDIATQRGANDVLFFYIDGGLKYRQQRDRYQIERLLTNEVTGRIARVGMNDKWRLQWEFE